MTDEYLTSEEVAKILDCSSVTVQRMVKRGHFPGTRKLDPTRKNSGLRIPRQAVDEFLKAQVVTPEKENE
jgi:excisionase family DNA binding protein